MRIDLQAQRAIFKLGAPEASRMIFQLRSPKEMHARVFSLDARVITCYLFDVRIDGNRVIRLKRQNWHGGKERREVTVNSPECDRVKLLADATRRFFRLYSRERTRAPVNPAF